MFEDLNDTCNPQGFKDYFLWGGTENPKNFEKGTMEERQQDLDRKLSEFLSPFGEEYGNKFHYFIDRYNTLYFELGMRSGFLIAQGLELSTPPKGGEK